MPSNLLKAAQNHHHRLISSTNQLQSLSAIMSLSTAIGLLAWGGFVSAAPRPEANPEPQLSLPPLIPLIPGVTEPLTENAPPLPILQVPTPPLESPPWEGSEIKPKKIGIFSFNVTGFLY